MRHFLFIFILIVLLSACQKESERMSLAYRCECGTVNWNNSIIDLTDSHYIVTASDTTDQGVNLDLGKDYFITAKFDTEADVEPHHLNMKISVPDVTLGTQNGLGAPFFYNFSEGTFSVQIEEINFNSLSTVDKYAVSAGNITISPDSGSNTDNLSFELEALLTMNGQSVGTPFIFTGNFISTKENL